MMKIECAEDYRAWNNNPASIYSKKVGRSIRVPCLNVVLVRVGMVVANAYNPNSIPPDKMDLLRKSILDNGWCFPIVTVWDDERELFVIVDGFHRNLIASGDWLDCDYVPIVVLDLDPAERMSATVQFNKAKGIHSVELDADLIRKLINQGLSDDEVSEKLGMDVDSVHRYKQVSGIAEIFRGANYSMAWEMQE